MPEFFHASTNKQLNSPHISVDTFFLMTKFFEIVVSNPVFLSPDVGEVLPCIYEMFRCSNGFLSGLMMSWSCPRALWWTTGWTVSGQGYWGLWWFCWPSSCTRRRGPPRIPGNVQNASPRHIPQHLPCLSLPVSARLQSAQGHAVSILDDVVVVVPQSCTGKEWTEECSCGESGRRV